MFHDNTHKSSHTTCILAMMFNNTQRLLVWQPAQQNNINSTLTLTLTLIKIICMGYIALCIRNALY